jgi:hypothetical protein
MHDIFDWVFDFWACKKNAININFIGLKGYFKLSEQTKMIISLLWLCCECISRTHIGNFIDSIGYLSACPIQYIY